MTRRIGDRASFAVEVGAAVSRDQRVVDLWAAGRRLTVHDNAAYLPSLCPAMRRTAAQVRAGEVLPGQFPGRSPEYTFRLLHRDRTGFRERFWFLLWGETLDNVDRYAYLDGDLVLAYSFWRPDHPRPEECGRVFAARVAPEEFVDILLTAADLLDAEHGRRAGRAGG